MASTSANSLYVNIKELPVINDINNGDFLIVETPDGTNIIDYQDFFITLQNTTFESTITNLQTDTQTISGDLATLINTLEDVTSNGSSAALTGDAYPGSPNIVKVINGSSYTLISSDNGRILICSNPGAMSVVVPTGLSSGFNCQVIQNDTGEVTFTNATNVVLNSFGSLFKTSGRYAAASLVSTASNVFVLAGNLK